MPAPSYVLGTSAAERDRLLEQARALEPSSAALLDAIGIAPGWRTVDVGCGPLGIAPQLAARVGSTGEVVAVEPQPAFAAAAREQCESRGLPQVQVIEGSADDLRLPRGHFDLVHARLVMMVAPDKARLLGQLVALARPGGLVALQDFDRAGAGCEPPHPAWPRLDAATAAVYRQRGLDVGFGRRLPALLAAAGLHDVQVRVQARVSHAGDPAHAQFLTLAADLRAPIVAADLIDGRTFDTLLAAAQAHLARPDVMVVHPLLFQAWGRRPV
ncbi:MAG: methyltransferase domain-containing protein [Deltaproteobacteria bacterium]|nr:methyltransferase domain-containing protein [Deltaproteobacteria bacterium]